MNKLTDAEKALRLQNILIAHATGSEGDDDEYKILRKYFLDNRETKNLLPDFVRTTRDLAHFWGYIKAEFSHYDERQKFIWEGFGPLLDFLEDLPRKPPDTTISDALKSFDAEGVHAVWQKALERRTTDPEGAITAARTLLETVCKHILENRGVQYDDKMDLPPLFKLTSEALNLAPSQHTIEIFKQILGGVTSVVTGLGALRNKISDAHGQGKRPVRPAARHAQLAVNLAGTLSLFLVETWLTRSEKNA